LPLMSEGDRHGELNKSQDQLSNSYLLMLFAIFFGLPILLILLVLVAPHACSLVD